MIFHAWLNQTETDFGKARSVAIRAAKQIIEAQGFTLPEPIYRLRFDSTAPFAPAIAQSSKSPPKAKPLADTSAGAAMSDDEHDIKSEVDAVREAAAKSAESLEDNLLDDKKPVE